MKAIHEFPYKEDYKKYLRAYFAGLAMQGLLASMSEKAANGNWGSEQDILAKKSIEIADELLKQLEIN